MELATLKGTEKQVNWAKAIRNDRLKVWQKTDPDGFREVESILTKQSASAWWITSKDKGLNEVCRQLAGASGADAPKGSAKKTSPRVDRGGAVKMPDDVSLWETVSTATGFRRSGPTMDMVTGAVVTDASLPF